MAKKRRGRNRRKTRAFGKGWRNMLNQVERAAQRRSRSGKAPTKGMRRFDVVARSDCVPGSTKEKA